MSETLHIGICGDGHSEIHEKPLAKAFESIGHAVTIISWHQHFPPGRLFGRIGNRFKIGPGMRKVNSELITQTRIKQFNFIFFYRPTHIYSKTLDQLRAEFPATMLIGYNNDDPYSQQASKVEWRLFYSCVPRFDLMCAYRPSNIDDYRVNGARDVALLMPWYVPSMHCRLPNITRDLDVVFIGHYEPDERMDYFEYLAANGVSIKVFGPGYPNKIDHPHIAPQFPVSTPRGVEYNLILNRAKIALCFFSKLNRDVYTRRCFEIPAAGACLLSEYSEDLAQIFIPDNEAVYFRSRDELLAKIRWLLSDPVKCTEIANRSHQRLVDDGHDVEGRAKQIIEFYKRWTSNKIPPTKFDTCAAS